MNIDIFKHKNKYCYNNNSEFHNSYGPAEINPDHYKLYCINDKFHNPHGPAVIYPGDIIEYWLNGIGYFKEEWEELRHDY